jgi:hypothetical protein
MGIGVLPIYGSDTVPGSVRIGCSSCFLVVRRRSIKSGTMHAEGEGECSVMSNKRQHYLSFRLSLPYSIFHPPHVYPFRKQSQPVLHQENHDAANASFSCRNLVRMLVSIQKLHDKPLVPLLRRSVRIIT